MNRILIIFTIILLFIALNLLGQRSDTLMSRYQYLDSVIDASSQNQLSACVIAAKSQVHMAVLMKNDSLAYESKIKLAEALNELSFFDQTIDILYELLSKIEKNPADKRISKVQFKLGASYFQMEDYDKAYSFFQKSKHFAVNHKLHGDTVAINSELGLTMVALGQKKDGLALLYNNVNAAKKTGDEETICIALDNLSNAYFELGNYQKSLKYQEEILNYPEVSNASLQRKAAIQQHLATINIKLKKWATAQKHTDLSIKYASQLGSNYWLFDCYKDQADIYEASGKYKDALAFHQKYIALKDSVYKSDYDIKMSTMANLYDVQNKEHQIKELTSSQDLIAAKVQRLYLILAAFGLLVGLMITYYFYRKNKLEKEFQQKIAFYLLHAQEEERQRISKELHDSVGQNILFIKNQINSDMSSADLTKLRKSVDTALEELRNISKNLYPNQLEKYGLIAAVESLAEEVNQHSSIFVSSDLEGIDDVLNKNVKINFYRIIQEFVNNTLKHADATSIRITAQQINDTIELIVQDNGKGFDKLEWERTANKSFGLINMEERIKMLKGKCSIESEPGKGTKSIFTIPI
jgi:signal transduction histidine kinase